MQKLFASFVLALFLYLFFPLSPGFGWPAHNQNTDFLSYEELKTLSANPHPGGKLEEQVTNWTKTQTHQTEHSALSLIFAPHLLPKNYPLLLGNKACWVGLQDFREKPSKKGYTYWMACLGNMDLKDVPQVKAINDCWLKITKKEKK